MLRTGGSPHAVVQVNAARLAHKRRTFYVWRAWRRPVSSGLRHFGGFVLLYSIIGCLTEELTLEILYTL